MENKNPRQELISVLKRMNIPYIVHVKNVNFSVVEDEDVRVYFRKNAIRVNLRLWLEERYNRIDKDLFYFSDNIKADLPTGVINPTPFVKTENIESFIRALFSEGSTQTVDINTPLKPKNILKSDSEIHFICGKCGYDFRKADRCPECGQLVKADS